MKRKSIEFFAIILIFFLFPVMGFAGETTQQGTMPEIFVDIREIIPDVILDIRYFGPYNFVGTKIDGYEAPRCLLTRQAAVALAEVQKELKGLNLCLKIFDCYRPQRAQNHFVRWAKDITDTKMKMEFYPTIDKRDLIRDGYIAEKSGHSRGSTVDLTIVSLAAKLKETYTPDNSLDACRLRASNELKDNGIDMGTGFDCFHERSHTLNKGLEATKRMNRRLLKCVMERHGFVNFDREWWHYKLKAEPFPDTYFDFPIK